VTVSRAMNQALTERDMDLTSFLMSQSQLCNAARPHKSVFEDLSQEPKNLPKPLMRSA
jgi:hypothetical protein